MSNKRMDPQASKPDNIKSPPPFGVSKPETAASTTGGLLLVLAGAIFWGTTGTAQALAPEGAHPLLVGTVRISTAAFVMLVAAIVKNIFRGYKNSPRNLIKSVFNNSPGIRNPLFLLACLGIASYQLLFFTGAAMTGVAVGTVVTMGSVPIFTGLLNWMTGRGSPEKIWYPATCLAVIGCGFLLFGKHTIYVSPLGICIAASGGLSFAVYVITSKKLLQRYSTGGFLLSAMLFSAFLLSPNWFIFDTAWLLEPAGIMVAIHLGVISTALSYGLFTKGLRSVKAPTASTLTLAEPVTAALLGTLFLHEVLSFSAALGIFFVFCGLAIISLHSLITVSYINRTKMKPMNSLK